MVEKEKLILEDTGGEISPLCFHYIDLRISITVMLILPEFPRIP
ncbi:hypothetical protein [Methanosarcina mazei]|nr:hypothetical protein [Methanosarcina mazei]